MKTQAVARVLKLINEVNKEIRDFSLVNEDFINDELVIDIKSKTDYCSNDY